MNQMMLSEFEHVLQHLLDLQVHTPYNGASEEEVPSSVEGVIYLLCVPLCQECFSIHSAAGPHMNVEQNI